MDAGFGLLFILWLILIFAIPSGAYALYKEVKGGTCCSSLTIAISFVIAFMIVAFYIFSLIIFPVLRAHFL